MTKFYETCNRCDAEVICDCPYCEKLLEALKEVIDYTHGQGKYNYAHILSSADRLLASDDAWVKIDVMIKAAIKEADNG